MKRKISREAIRLRPGMFIGDTGDGSGLNHMILELVANSLDEHLTGHCSCITIEIAEDGAMIVEDDGRGISIEEIDGISFAEKALTSFHNTATLDGHAPHLHIATFGVGMFVVCALSTYLDLDVFREGQHYAQRFECGVAVSKLVYVGTTERTGTRIKFMPDPSIFTPCWLNPGALLNELKDISYLFPSLKLQFQDHRKQLFHQPDGLIAYVRDISGDIDYCATTPFHFLVKEEDIVVEVAANWHASHYPWPRVESFANAMRTTEGGSHVSGFLSGLTAGFTKATVAKRADRYTSKGLRNAIQNGLIAIVSVRLSDPSYAGPTKHRLVTKEVSSVVKRCVRDHFAQFLQNEPALLEHIEKQITRTS